jgi:hypothetical protein
MCYKLFWITLALGYSVNIFYLVGKNTPGVHFLLFIMLKHLSTRQNINILSHHVEHVNRFFYDGYTQLGMGTNRFTQIRTG